MATKQQKVAQAKTTTPAKPAAKRAASAKPAKSVRAPVPQAQPLFRDKDGRALQNAAAVLQVIERDEDGTPRLLRLVDLISGAASQTAAAAEARKSGKLPADADAVTAKVRYLSTVDMPREPEAPAGPRGGGGVGVSAPAKACQAKVAGSPCGEPVATRMLAAGAEHARVMIPSGTPSIYKRGSR